MGYTNAIGRRAIAAALMTIAMLVVAPAVTIAARAHVVANGYDTSPTSVPAPSDDPTPHQ
jgi:hypothetical protein